MRTTVKLLIDLAILLALLLPTKLAAQECQTGEGCSYPGGFESSAYHIGTQFGFELVSYLTGTPTMRRFMLVEGETYEWSTRVEDGGSGQGDTELTLYNNLGSQILCYANDADGPGAQLTYTATATNQVFLRITQAPCSTLVAPATIVWRCATCADLLEVRVTATGPSTNPCGEDVRLCDMGGPNNYPNHASAQMVLLADGDSRINLRGWYAIEADNDQLVLYDGTGTEGTILAQLDNVGFLDHTGEPGQTITVRFHSDQSVTMAGFDFTVTYSGSCDGVGIAEQEGTRWQAYPNPTSGMISLRSDRSTGPMTVTLMGLLGQVEQVTSHAGITGSIQLAASPGYHMVEIIEGQRREVHRVLVH
ncbi:MAG: hypothetical protein KDB95_08090 [Flavobacteriales bacterium]|nr:hypothetical protein [Flavobacteriales bacterium]